MASAASEKKHQDEKFSKARQILRLSAAAGLAWSVAGNVVGARAPEGQELFLVMPKSVADAIGGAIANTATPETIDALSYHMHHVGVGPNYEDYLTEENPDRKIDIHLADQIWRDIFRDLDAIKKEVDAKVDGVTLSECSSETVDLLLDIPPADIQKMSTVGAIFYLHIVSTLLISDIQHKKWSALAKDIDAKESLQLVPTVQNLA